MKIVVCVKWVGSIGDDVEFSATERSVDPDYLDFVLNQWDACATEEALRLREAAGGGEVVAVTVGGAESEKALVHCLAMGVDRVLRVKLRDDELTDPFTVGRCLALVIAPEQPDLVLCGAQSSDAAQGATGAVTAAFLDLPCATVVTHIECVAPRSLTVKRELEGGITDIVDIDGPAVLTIQTGINEPRYVTLRAIQQAQRNPIALMKDVDATAAASYRVRRMYAPVKPRAEMIGGGAAAVAARITELVREATA